MGLAFLRKHRPGTILDTVGVEAWLFEVSTRGFKTIVLSWDELILICKIMYVPCQIYTRPYLIQFSFYVAGFPVPVAYNNE